jgi:hypothetical protein
MFEDDVPNALIHRVLLHSAHTQHNTPISTAVVEAGQRTGVQSNGVRSAPAYGVIFDIIAIDREFVNDIAQPLWHFLDFACTRAAGAAWSVAGRADSERRDGEGRGTDVPARKRHVMAMTPTSE